MNGFCNESLARHYVFPSVEQRAIKSPAKPGLESPRSNERGTCKISSPLARGGLSGEQLPQHERQDAAVQVVVDFDRRVDAHSTGTRLLVLPSLRWITSVTSCCGLMSASSPRCRTFRRR